MKIKFIKFSITFTIAAIFISLGSTPMQAKSRKERGKGITNPNKNINQNKPNFLALNDSKSKPENTLNLEAKREIKNDNINTDQDDKKIYLNFENAELINFINYIADIKQINILPDKSLTEGNKISLTTRNPVTIDQAWKILLSIADTAGFSIVKVGDLYKIIPNKSKLTEPLPIYINVDPKTLPDSDETIRYVYFLTNIKVGDVIDWIKSMLGDPNLAIPNESNNGLILTARSLNIKALMKIVQELDKSGLKESVSVLRLKEANAKEVKDLLEALIKEEQPNQQLARLHLLLGKKMAGSTSSYFASGTKIIAEERTNSLILLGSRETTKKIEDFIVEHIDIKLKGVDSPLHIYELQYMDAKEMVALLKEVLVPPESQGGQEAGMQGGIRGGVKYFKNIQLQADSEGNRIVASAADKLDWKLLKQTIKDLDKPQPEVAIETLIVLVDSEDDKQLGGQIRNKKHGQLGRWVDFQSSPIGGTIYETKTVDDTTTNVSLLGNLINSLTGGLGSTVLTFGKSTNIWSVLQMLRKQTHTSLIARPFLTIANKYTSNIVIGETRRVISQTAVVNEGSNTVTGYEDTKANLEVDVTPQINMDGVINLKINVNIDDFIANDPKNKITRNVSSNVSVASGQVLALGGFAKEKISEVVSKTPIIGNVPGLGWFFKNKTKTKIKQHILVFMCPTIIKPRRYGMNLYTRMKMDQAKECVQKDLPIGKSHDPINNWFFDPNGNSYKQRIEYFETARFQPATVDIKNDPYYRSHIYPDIPEKADLDEQLEETPPSSKKTSLTSENITDKGQK